MKKVVIVSILTMISFGIKAQEDAISKFYHKYAQDDSFTQVNITSRMFGLFSNLDSDDPEDKEVLQSISKIKGLKILAKENINNGKELYNEAYNMIDKKEYEELMTVKDKDSDMRFLIKEKNGIIAELLMISGSTNSFLLLSLVGDIDLKQISKLSKSMDINGFDKLENIDENESEKSNKN